MAISFTLSITNYPAETYWWKVQVGIPPTSWTSADARVVDNILATALQTPAAITVRVLNSSRVQIGSINLPYMPYKNGASYVIDFNNQTITGDFDIPESFYIDDPESEYF